MTERWTSVEDIARHLGVAKDSIYRWIERRSLPGHRIGRLWKFKISEVDEWVRRGSLSDSPGSGTGGVGEPAPASVRQRAAGSRDG